MVVLGRDWGVAMTPKRAQQVAPPEKPAYGSFSGELGRWALKNTFV